MFQASSTQLRDSITCNHLQPEELFGTQAYLLWRCSAAHPKIRFHKPISCTCALQLRSPPLFPEPSWIRWDTSCTPSELSRHRHLKPDKKEKKITQYKLYDEQSSDECKMHPGIVKWDTILACQPSMLTQRSIHHQKSSSDSPFHANTGTPVEKHPLLMEDRREVTRKPSSWSIRPGLHRKRIHTDGSETLILTLLYIQTIL